MNIFKSILANYGKLIPLEEYARHIGVTIGKGCCIASSFFLDNVVVPSNSIDFGNPCIIKHRDYSTNGYINNLVDS